MTRYGSFRESREISFEFSIRALGIPVDKRSFVVYSCTFSRSLEAIHYKPKYKPGEIKTLSKKSNR